MQLRTRQPNNELKLTITLQIQVIILCWSIDTSHPWLCRIVLPNEYTLIFYHMLGFFCIPCSGGWLTGAAGVRGVAVSAVEIILAGTNIGSSCTGATVGRAGGAGSLAELGFEGPWDAGWTSRRENKKEQREQKNNEWTPRCHLSRKTSGCHIRRRTKSCTCEVSAKLNIYGGTGGCAREKWQTLKHQVLSIHLHLLFQFHALCQVTLISPKRDWGWQLSFMLKRRKRRIKMEIDCWQEIAVVRQTGMENASEKRDTP